MNDQPDQRFVRSMDAPKPHILFVDDEPEILRALERSLRKDGARWDLTFVLGAPSALQVLAVRSAHVVVSDMSMPEMSGEDFLLRVHGAYPATVAMLCTGHATVSVTPRLQPFLYALIAKPWSRDEMRAMLERAVCLARGSGSAEP